MFVVAKFGTGGLSVVDATQATKAAAEARAATLAKMSDDTFVVFGAVSKYQRKVEVNVERLDAA